MEFTINDEIMDELDNEISEENEISKENEKNEVIIEDCVELKNIKYKTMMLNGTPLIESKVSANNLDTFLENEKNSNMNDSWSNLDKTSKIKKLTCFAEIYKVENSLTDIEYELLIKFLKEALDHKKIQRVKDVVYDKATGVIKSIPCLNYNKSTNHFTLKNIDKRISTLKSLPPKKNARGTAKTRPL
jgi:hypothetical protein